MGRDRRSKDVDEFLSEFRADLGRIRLEVGGLEDLAIRFGLPPAAKEAAMEAAVSVLEPSQRAPSPVAEAVPKPRGSEPAAQEPPLDETGARAAAPAADFAPQEPIRAATERVQPAPHAVQPDSGPPTPPPPAAASPAAVPSREPQARPARPEFPPAAPPEREPAAARSPRWLAWTALALLIGGAGAWRGYRVWEDSIERRAHRVFPLPFTHSALLAGDGRRLFTMDPVRSLLFTIDSASLKVGAIQKMAGPRPGGLAWSNAALWSTDSEAGRIVEHAADPGLSVRRAFTNPESRPTALFWDSRHLWTHDARTETISQYAVGDTLKLVRQYTLTGIDPIGLYVGGDLLWVMDRATQRILRYRPKSLLEEHDALDFAPWLPPRSQVTGFTVQDGVVWFVTENPAEVHGFNLALWDGRHARRRARSLMGGRP